MRFDRLTAKLQEALAEAQSLAVGRDNTAIEPGHVLSALLAVTLDLTPGERALIWALGLLILAAELMNTGLEEVVDYLSRDTDPRAKKAKDCGSAAVALTAIAGGVAWVVILVG